MARKPVTRRASPDLPSVCDDLDPVDADQLIAGQLLEQALIRNIDLSNRSLAALKACTSVFDRVLLAGCTISSSHLRDVRFIKCDLSNAVLLGSEATRVEFIDCRLTGIRAIECRWRDVLVENSDLRYAQFTNGKLLGCEFKQSNLAESDLRSADLEGSIFTDAILNQSDLSAAKLRGVDLRGAEIEGIVVHADDVRGAIVTAPQALDLSRLLGLVIAAEGRPITR